MALFLKGQLFFLLTIIIQTVAASDHVLVLNSYHPQYLWSLEHVKGIEDTLRKEIPLENIHTEYLDSRRYTDDREYQRYMLELINYKYKQRFDISVVMTNEDFALDFALENRVKIFNGAPIVFSGVNGDFTDKLKNVSDITGIYEGIDVNGNIALIHRTQPDIERIVLITDQSLLGKRAAHTARDTINKVQAKYPNTQFDIWDNYTIDGLKNDLSRLPPRSAALILIMQQDKNGKYFSYQRDLRGLSEASPQPIYGLWGPVVLGNGVLGGNMISPYTHGENAAHMALEVLRGVPADKLPIVEQAYYHPHFDHLELTRFGISKSHLPKDSVIINIPKKPYEKLLKVFIVTLLIAVLLFLLSMIMLRNIRQRIRAEEKLKVIAYQDDLTNLPNKNSLIRLLSQAEKNKRPPLLLSLADIINFRYINEKLGYQAGDQLLKTVAKTIQNALPSKYFVGRFAADEFYIVCEASSHEKEHDIANEIKEIFSKIFIPHNHKISLAVNIGMVNFPQQAKSAYQAINYLEAIKNEVKSRTDIDILNFCSTVPSQWRQRSQTELLIKEALKHDQLEIFYQPKVSIKKSRIVGVEGLIRIRQPNSDTVISPNEFIAVAEKSYLIQEINLYVIKKAIDDANEWHKKGLNLVPISINISNFSAYQDEIICYLKNIMSLYPHLKGLIEIELTESIFIHDIDVAKGYLNQLNDIGIATAIDDFGSGWSNLSYLKKLSVKNLKIDRSLIQDIEHDQKSQNIVAAIYSLVKNTSAAVVVEGVENRQQVEMLRSIDCDVIQGFVYYKPMPKHNFEVLINSDLDSEKQTLRYREEPATSAIA